MICFPSCPSMCSIWLRLLCRLCVEGSPNLFYVSAVAANGFVELIASNSGLFGPVGNIGCHFWIDLFRIVWAFVCSS